MPGSVRKTYFTIKGSYTWQEARWACNSRGGTLAILRTPREDDFVRQNVDIDLLGGNVWIGLRRMNSKYFEWVDGTMARYTPWFPQEITNQMPDVTSPNCTMLKRWQVIFLYFFLFFLQLICGHPAVVGGGQEPNNRLGASRLLG